MARLHPFLGVTALGLGLCLAACSDPKTARDVNQCAKTTGDTVGSAAKTGGTTAVAGVEQFGGAVGGFFQGGTDEAKRRWNEGKQKTRETATEGARDTDATSRRTDCK